MTERQLIQDAEIARLRGQVGQLQAAIRKYGDHLRGCAFWISTKPCSCGLRKLVGKA